MSLQLGLSGYNYISQYSRYNAGVPDASAQQQVPGANSADEQKSAVGSSQEAILMKKMGAAECGINRIKDYTFQACQPMYKFKSFPA
ncbi:MAG: hypothetical protein ACYCYE_00310 [Clostridia bacterium]